MHNPNFPENLTISPLVSPQCVDESPFNEPAQREAIERYGIAGRVWEAAYLLNMYLEKPQGCDFDPSFVSESQGPLTVLELGSGMGIVASKIADDAQAGRDLIIATDLPEVCPLLEENLKHHLKHSSSDGVILVRPLAWGDVAHALQIASELSTGSPRVLTHIVCSDLIYFPELLAPLLRSLIQLSSPHFISSSQGQSPTVIISYKIRSLPKETSFWSAFGLWFTFEPVLTRPSPESAWRRLGSSLDEPTFVFVARRRVPSFDWHMPADNQDLLDGVGAWGTETRKGDDKFENLLFMTLDNEDIGHGHDIV